MAGNIFRDYVASKPGTLIYANQSATRSLPVNEKLAAVLSYAAAEAGIDAVKVISGGQPKIGTSTKRTGSIRHDEGNAADLQLIVDGKPLDFTDPVAQSKFSTFVTAASAAGATGIGAGVDYMGPQTIHVGFGSPATWGAKGKSANAPAWLRAAVAAGKNVTADVKAGVKATVQNLTAPGKPTPGVLKKGMMNSPAVETLQRQLQQAGFYKGKIDGDFGRQTEKAVRDYQATQGLAVDGKAGPQTLGSLNTVAPVPGASSTYAGDVFGGMPRPPSMPADAFMTAGLPRPPLDPSGMDFANASLGGPSPGPGGAVGADLGAFPYPRAATRPTMVAGRPDGPLGGLPPAPLETMVAGRDEFPGSLPPSSPVSPPRPVLGPAGDPIARDMAARQQRARDQMAENDAAFAPRPPVPAPDRFTGPGNNVPNTLPPIRTVGPSPSLGFDLGVLPPAGGSIGNVSDLRLPQAPAGPDFDATTYGFGASEDMGLQRYLAGLGGIPGSLGADPAAANVPPASSAGGAAPTPPPMPPVPGANGNVVLMEGSRISPYAGPFSRAGSALGAAAGSENPYGLQMPPADYLNLSPNFDLKPMGSLSIPPGGIKVADASGAWPAMPPQDSSFGNFNYGNAVGAGTPPPSAASMTSPESDYYGELFGGLDQKGLGTIKLPDPMAPSTQTLKDIGSLLGSAVSAPPTPAQQDYATRKATTATSQALPAGMNFTNASLPVPQSSSGGLFGSLSNFWNNAQNTNANWAVPGNWLSPSPLHPAGSPNVWSPWGPAVESGTQAWTDQYNVTHMY